MTQPTKTITLTLTDLSAEPDQPKAIDATHCQIGIASEGDGDLAGFYIFDKEALEASTDIFDAWQFLCSSKGAMVSRHDTISGLLAEISARKLTITGEFGICVY